MGTIGRYGCYFLSIVRAAERMTGKRIDAVQIYNDATLARWMDSDCFVVKPDLIIGMMTGIKWAGTIQ